MILAPPIFPPSPISSVIASTHMLIRLAFALLFLAPAAAAQEFGAFVSTGEMTTVRVGHTSTLLADGRVLIAGGLGRTSAERLQSAELYDPVTGTFAPTGDMTTGRSHHTATRLDNGIVLIAGGVGSGGSLATAELYDPSTGMFVPTGDLITPQAGHAAVLLTNGKVLIAGGLIVVGNVPMGADAEIYDFSTGTFAPAGPYSMANTMFTGSTGIIWPSLTRLVDGRILVTGNKTAELYDSVSGTFHATGDMASDAYRWGMYWHTSTALLNGKVLVAGGTDDLSHLNVVDLYDAATGLFTPIGRMNERRSLHTATLMPDGSVLIIGGETWLTTGNYGWFGGSLANAERYDPSTGAFLPAGSMAQGRAQHQATLLHNGSVLVTGGMRYYPYPSPSSPPHPSTGAELYVPAVASAPPQLVSVWRDGQVVELYCAGMGDASNVVLPEVTIGGLRAEVVSVTRPPDHQGLSRIQARMPSGVPTGAAVPVRLFYLERPSNELLIP